MLEEYRKKKKLDLLEDVKEHRERNCMIEKNNLTVQIPEYRFESVKNGQEAYFCTDSYMYYLSDFFKRLQPIYDNHVVTA